MPRTGVQFLRDRPVWRGLRTHQSATYEGVMSKGMDQKKAEKKQPTKTLKEKRAAKAEKKSK